MLLKCINFTAIVTVFMSGFVFYDVLPTADLKISYFLLIIVFFLCIFFLKGICINTLFLKVLVSIMFLSFLSIYMGNNSFKLLTKQVFGIFLHASTFYLLIKLNKYNIKKLFNIYLSLALIVGVIGIFQEVSYLLNFEIGYDFSCIIPSWRMGGLQKGFLRVNSIMSEPASFCYSMMPAFFVSIATLFKSSYSYLKKWQCLIIVISFLLTFSSVGYIGIIFSFGLLFFNYAKIQHAVFGVLMVAVLTVAIYTNVDGFKMKVDDTMSVINGESSLETTNLSTFSWVSNALVAHSSFKNNPVFGSGLGSHEISYFKYIHSVLDVNKTKAFLNYNDANSLFLRVLSEGGLLGLLILFYFILKYFLPRRKDKSDYLWVINNSILAMFVVRLIRCGHYFNIGFFFFIWLYYFTWRLNQVSLEEGET